MINRQMERNISKAEWSTKRDPSIGSPSWLLYIWGYYTLVVKEGEIYSICALCARVCVYNEAMWLAFFRVSFPFSPLRKRRDIGHANPFFEKKNEWEEVTFQSLSDFIRIHCQALTYDSIDWEKGQASAVIFFGLSVRYLKENIELERRRYSHYLAKFPKHKTLQWAWRFTAAVTSFQRSNLSIPYINIGDGFWTKSVFANTAGKTLPSAPPLVD